MEAQRFHGASARQLRLLWYGGSLAIWAVAVLMLGWLLLLGQMRQLEQAFVNDIHATLRRLEQALQANEQALAAMTAFLKSDPRRNVSDFNRYVRHLLQAYPQIHAATLLLLPDEAGAQLEQTPLAGGQLGHTMLASLRQAIGGANTINATFTMILPDQPQGQEAFLLVQPLMLQETTRLALLLKVAIAQALPTAEALPAGRSMAFRLITPVAEAGEVWWRVNGPPPGTHLSLLPILRLDSRLGSSEQHLAVTSYQQLSWNQVQPKLVIVFAAAALLGLGLALAYGHSRLRREQERRESELQLYQLANFDSLTGLPNRNLFKARLLRALTQARLRSLGVALCFVDLDGFKAVNDSAGHEAGDRLLQLVGRRLLAAVRSHDLVARLSGDEFVVVMEGIGDKVDAERLTTKLQACFSQPFAVDTFQFRLTASVGFAVFPDDGEHPAQLLRRADARMYASKYADWSAAATATRPTTEAASCE